MRDDDRDAADQELDLDIAGQKIRTKGYRLIDLIWLPLFLGVLYCSLVLYQQQASAAGDKKDMAAAVKENNASLVQAIKDSNLNTVAAIRELADQQKQANIEQRKATTAIKEIACLSDPLMQRRSDAREFCKRQFRDDR